MLSTSSPTARHSTSPRRKPVSRTTIWQIAPLLASSRGHAVPRETLSAPLAVFLSKYDKAFSLCLPSSTAALALTEKPSIGRSGVDIAGISSVVFLYGGPCFMEIRPTLGPSFHFNTPAVRLPVGCSAWRKVNREPNQSNFQKIFRNNSVAGSTVQLQPFVISLLLAIPSIDKQRSVSIVALQPATLIHSKNAYLDEIMYLHFSTAEGYVGTWCRLLKMMGAVG